MSLPRRARPLAAAGAAALAAGALAVGLTSASSHREAPNIMLDPTADNTDLYAFSADDAPKALTVVSNWIPFEDPAGGPNFYRFDDKARYWINIDNTGDGRYDVRYLFRFHSRIKNKNSYLYAVPPVNSLHDKNLNFVQSYTVTRLTLNRHETVTSRKRVAHALVAPNNVGPKTMPNYAELSAEAQRRVRGGGRVFAGQVDDPFFVDLGAAFDALNLRSGTGNQGGGKDDLAGYGVHTTVLQVPEAQVTRNHRAVGGPTARNAVIGVWTSTDRRVVSVRGHRAHRRWQQVSRLGNPLINELIIPLGRKDEFNRTEPQDDAANYGKYALSPEPAHLLNALFGLGVKEHNRKDIVQALLTGLPGKTQISPKAVPADTLKVNLGVPPTPPAEQKRLGVLDGDLGGFPDGRRLGDDVTDIELRVIGGALIGKSLPLGDGVDQNDKAFRSSFPYVALPTSGFDAKLKRTEPPHPPTP